MDYYGDIVDVRNNYQLVGIGEVGISSDDAPVLVTREIQTCVAMLLITEECAAMLHINFEDKKDYSKGLSDLNELLKKYNGKIQKFQMFLGCKTLSENIEKLKDVFDSSQLDLEIYHSYLDGDMGSIAYDFKQEKYYGLDIDNNFRNYILGAGNKNPVFILEELIDKSL